MKSAKSIFEVLKRLREYADGTGSFEELEAINKLENIAMQEIYNVKLEPESGSCSKVENDNYAKVMAIVFPDLVIME
jgi:hypothetical protein